MGVIVFSLFVLTLTCVHSIPISNELNLVEPKFTVTSFSNGFLQDPNSFATRNRTAFVLKLNQRNLEKDAESLVKKSNQNASERQRRQHKLYKRSVVNDNLKHHIDAFETKNETLTTETTTTYSNQDAMKTSTLTVDEIEVSENVTNGNNLNTISFIENKTKYNISIDNYTSTAVYDLTENVKEVTLSSTANLLHEDVQVVEDADFARNNILTRSNLNSHIQITRYEVTITPDVTTNVFTGSLTATAVLTDSNMIGNVILFSIKGLTITSVRYAVGGGSTYTDAFYSINADGTLQIVSALASLYTFQIQYIGSMDNGGSGLYYGSFGDSNYVAMNLYPTNARRVFPCIDELSQEATVSITLNNAATGYSNVIGNSVISSNENGVAQLTSLSGLLHKWGMVTSNFVHLINPVPNSAKLFVRSGITNQDSQGSTIINYVFSEIQAWTNKMYIEIVANQEGFMNFIAMPDITKDWVALSTVPIWEPHILMLSNHAVAQRKSAMIEISKGISRQWFGYVIHPEDWRYQWIIEGLGSHVAYEMASKFQGQSTENNITMIDVQSIFVTEVMQEALQRDAYRISTPLEPADNIITENAVREHLNGLMKYKAPAMMKMLRNALGEVTNVPVVDGVTAADDYIQTAARALLASRALQSVNRLNFIDAINSDYSAASTQLIPDLPDFLGTWVSNSGYPLIRVDTTSTGFTAVQIRKFGYSATNSDVVFKIPVTYTTSVNPNFDDTPVIMEATLNRDLFLDEEAEDWVIFNLKGQGYYRVKYANTLWERLITALSDPATREVIHPINRATLLDDVLNLARANEADYDIALRLVLTMEHETNYVVWKTFIRNMDFIKKRLLAMVAEDEDLDPNIYRRMIGRTITAIESELSFYPDSQLIEDDMASMTRGIVMEHACKANYEPCIAAAIDWFYDPDSAEPAINTRTPQDMRPAVYCAVVMSGDVTARDLLRAEMDVTNSMYERLVIVKALACSQDETFILQILNSAISGGGGLGVEERKQFFISLIESSYTNAQLALKFMSDNTAGIRNMFGGDESIEELSYILAEHMVTADMTTNYNNWAYTVNSGLGDSENTVRNYVDMARENLVWNNVHMNTVYDWFDENDATTSVLSFTLILASLLITLFH